MSREVRTVAKLELRSDGSPGLRGYAAKFNTRSKPIYGMFTEEIAPGAFKRTLSEGEINVRALYNHKADFLLGSTRGGTVRLSEDETGLAVDLDLPDTQLGRDVQALVTRGDLVRHELRLQCPRRQVGLRSGAGSARPPHPHGRGSLRRFCRDGPGL
jgi:HK97 family phage prohead protease